MERIKKDDLVCVLTGKDKGATGQVMEIDRTNGRVLVKGVNVVTRHLKPKQRGEKGKIVKEEKFFAISNVMPVCPQTNKPTRVRAQLQESGKRVRVSVRSGQPF